MRVGLAGRLSMAATVTAARAAVLQFYVAASSAASVFWKPSTVIYHS